MPLETDPTDQVAETLVAALETGLRDGALLQWLLDRHGDVGLYQLYHGLLLCSADSARFCDADAMMLRRLARMLRTAHAVARRPPERHDSGACVRAHDTMS